MRILGLETSTRHASIVLDDGASELVELQMPSDDRTAVWLAAAIEEALNLRQWDRDSIDLVALTSGPGSFTGLRIGVTTAKMLSFAWRIPLVALDTLEVIAAQGAAELEVGHLSVIMDARRGAVFAADFECAAGQLQRRVSPTQVLLIDDWMSALGNHQSAAVTGPKVEAIQDQLPLPVRALKPNSREPRATTVATLARSAWERGERIEPAALMPNYYRPSYAERSTP